jgi:Ca2+-transporting ATPase
MNPLGNKALLLGIAGSVLAILSAVYVPFLQYIFRTEPLTYESWSFVLAAALLVVLAAEVMKRVLFRPRTDL